MKNRNEKQKRYWGFIDFEFQSAIGNRRADLISVGIVVYDTKEKLFMDKYYSLIKPDKPVTERVSRLTGLSNELLKNANDWKEVSGTVEEFLKGYRQNILIYAYSNNDARTVEQVCKKYRMRNLFQKELRIRDASVIIQRRMKIFGNSLFEKAPSLSRLATFYNIEFKNKHNALEDARVLGAVFEKTMMGVYSHKEIVLPYLRENVSSFIKDLEWDGSVFNNLSLDANNRFELVVWQGNHSHRFFIEKRKTGYAVYNDELIQELRGETKQLLNHVLIMITFDETELINLLT